MKTSTATASALAAILLTPLALPGAAQAAVRPGAITTPAEGITSNAAVLTGWVYPSGSETSYYFQYGPTKSYGLQSAIGDVGSGTHGARVKVPIGGLDPITEYHYRLVAVNAGGATQGSDHTFLTKKVPLSLQITMSPNPVLFGGAVLVQGILSGTGNASRPVVLQASSFPFTTGFQDVSNPQLTGVTGSFSFPVLGLVRATQFRVATATSPLIYSRIANENVAVQVTSHVGRARRRHFARIYGTVTPAEDGMQVAILRIMRGRRSVLVAGTGLRHRNATSSSFSRVIPARPGVYQVLVRVTNGAQVSNYGRPLAIR